MAYDWIQRFPAHVPPGRFAHALCWDGARVLMYGGRQNSPGSLLGDTWTWDGEDWTERSPAHSPGPLEVAGIAYDIGNDQVVLFGGNSDEPSSTGGITDETWVWDRSDWTLLSPAHSPSARGGALLAYDETRGEVVLFCGYDSGGAMFTDTWTWDGTDWTEQFPANTPFDTGLANQNLGAMAWDPTNDLVVHTETYVGGGFFALRGTWTWDGTNWTQHTPASSPTGLELPGFANWRVGGKPLSFGGREGGLPNLETQETWTWDGIDWTPPLPAHVPRARGDIMLAYDEARREVLLFGGLVAAVPQFDDTWIYADTATFTLHLET